MIERIKEYLLSEDKETVMVGYELLKNLDLSPDEKSEIMYACDLEKEENPIVWGTMSSLEGIYWTHNNNRFWKERNLRIYPVDYIITPVEW